MRFLRYALKSSINRLGFDIKRIPKGMGRGVSSELDDPITAEYMPDLRSVAIFDIPIAKMRGLDLMGLPLTAAVHPYVRAFELTKDKRNAQRDAIKSVLKDYYDAICPSSALDVLNLTDDLAPGLINVPAIGALLPWSWKDIATVAHGRKIAMEMVGLQYGRRLNVEDGLTTIGPVTPAKLSLETDRLETILASVAQRGFVPDDNKNPLKVVGLRRDGAYRWLIEEGQHRLALAATLGIKSVPAIVTSVVRFDDAELWPQVTNGVFSVQGARSVFERLFEGDNDVNW